MSFSTAVKQEMMNRRLEKSCCHRAVCVGTACFSYAFSPRKLEIHTESPEIADYFVAEFSVQNISLRRAGWWSHGRELTGLSASEEGCSEFEAFYAQAVQLLCSVPNGEKKGAKRCEDCTGSFLAGAFLAAGTISDPNKEYHLEFVVPRPGLAELLCEKLALLGIEGHCSRKNGTEVVYLRASEQIEDLLTAMGAVHCAMDIMNEKIYKNYRNQANRITNCETANIDKIVAANVRVLAAIEILQKNGRIKLLPETLQQAAAARLAQPDISLAELAAGMQPPVSKSGLSHRLKKLVELAEGVSNGKKEGRESV